VSTAAPSHRRIAFAASVGNGLEWFDFAAYGLLATTLAQVFFPEELPSAGLLSTLAIFGVAFLVRPLAALGLGRLADRHGRRPVLLATMAVMSVSTLSIGLLPGTAQAGLLAPLLLLLARIGQGVAVGAEWGVSASFISEWAPPSRAGLFASTLGMTVALGTLLASLLIALITAWATPEAMLSWGWRIPFLVRGAIGLVGLVARARLPETPAYQQARQAPPPAERRLLLRRAALLAGITAYWTVLFYIVLSYVPTFVQAHGALDTRQALAANTAGLVVLVLLIPLAGALSDRFGRKRLSVASAAWTMLVTVPLVQLLVQASALQLVLALAVWALALGINGAIAPLLAAQLFPVQARSAWVATTYAVTVAVLGGSSPYLSEWLVQASGSPTAFAWLLVGFAGVGLWASLQLPDDTR